MKTSSVGRAGSQWPALLAVVVMVIGFTYSDDIVEFALTVIGASVSGWRWFVLAIDLALLAGAAYLKWRITRQSEPGLTWRQFQPRLLHSWWALGTVVVLALHVTIILLAGAEKHLPLWGSLAGAAVFVAAMGLVLASTLDTNAAPGVGLTRHGWAVPLVAGTFVVQVASALWFPVIDYRPSCANDISTDFFAQMVQVIPVLLITLGLEMGFLRWRNTVMRPADRAAPLLTVLLLCVAEGLAFSMLVHTGVEHCGVAAVWHEYIAFVVCVHATAIGMATLAWLLIAENSAQRPVPEGAEEL